MCGNYKKIQILNRSDTNRANKTGLKITLKKKDCDSFRTPGLSARQLKFSESFGKGTSSRKASPP